MDLDLLNHLTPLLGQITIPRPTPTTIGAPGSSELSQIMNWVFGYGLAICVVAGLLGAARMGWSALGGNPVGVANGRRMLVVAIGAAVCMTLVPNAITWGTTFFRGVF